MASPAAPKARPTSIPLLAFLLCCLAWLPAPALAQGDWVRVDYINDGDTVTVFHQGKRELVRLLGIDAPETRHSQRLLAAAQGKGRSTGQEAELGEQVRQWLNRHMSQGTQVRLEMDPFAPTRDQHGRMLAYLYLPTGPMINEILLQEGLVRAYAFCNCIKQERFLNLERRARAAKRGLWAQPGGP